MSKVIFSVFFSFCISIARQIDREGALHVPGAGEILSFVVMAVFCYVAFAIIGRLADRISSKLSANNSLIEDEGSLEALAPRIIPVFLFLVVAYGLVLWGVYPGFFTYDAGTEISLFTKNANTTWHPLFHTYTMCSLINSVHDLTGDYNLGIFSYIALQMVLFAGAFTYMYCELIRYRIPKAVRIICLGFLGLFPPVVMYVLCSATDSAFILCVMMYTLQVLALLCTPEIFRKEPVRFLLMGLFATLFMLYRKNGIYDFAVFIPFLICFAQKEYRRKLIMISLTSLVLFFAINSALINGLDAEKNGQQEAFAVPLQQLGRVYNYYREDFSEEDLEYLTSLQSLDRWQLYSDKVADDLKEQVDGKVILEDPGAFMSVYLKMFIKHPKAYFDAWLLTGYEMWYPGAIFDCFVGSGLYEQVSYFAWVTDMPGWRDLGGNYIDIAYRAISVKMWPHKIPILHYIWTPGFWLWFSIAACIYVSRKGSRGFARSFTLIFIIYLSMLLAPASFVRYVAYIFFTAPLMVCGILFPQCFAAASADEEAVRKAA